MRWYKIIVGGSNIWDATNDPYALNVEVDVLVKGYQIPDLSSYVRIWGIPKQLLLNARQFNGESIEVWGGMQKGLPLANPAQQGCLAKGVVQPCLGNWVGTDQTIDFYMIPGAGKSAPAGNANLVHNWPKNTPLAGPLKQTLQTAYPGFNVIVRISDQLKLPHDDRGFYQTLGQYNPYINAISHGILGGTIKNYQGVHITFDKKNNIIASDNTQQSPQGGKINFQDLIGLPIWISDQDIQFKCVMRGDLNYDDTITLPNVPALQNYQAGTQAATENNGNNNIAPTMIQGTFKIQVLHHVGTYRQPDWQSWCSIIEARLIGGAGASPTGSAGAPSGQGGIGHQ